MTSDEILDILEDLFPNAECELVHTSLYELIVAVSLSAQTTDAMVNRVTPRLFKDFPDVYALNKATVKEIEADIKQLGLYRNKAINLKKMAEMVVNDFKGIIPSTREDLVKLPGVGRKTANVVLSVWFKEPAIAVDTHVERIAKRLKFAYKNDSVEKVEQKLMRKIDISRWNRAHHLFIFFGRYMCHARNPKCIDCKFKGFCTYYRTLKIKV